MTYNMHVQKQSILTIYSGISLSLSLFRYDVQHSCTETLDTDNIFGPPSLSLWRATCMYRNTQHRHYIRAYLSISRYDVQHACRETLDTDNLFRPLSLSLVMTYNMHVHKHWILKIYSGLSLSLFMTYNMHVQELSTQTLYSGLSLYLSLWRTTCMYRNTRYRQ